MQKEFASFYQYKKTPLKENKNKKQKQNTTAKTISHLYCFFFKEKSQILKFTSTVSINQSVFLPLRHRKT